MGALCATKNSRFMLKFTTERLQIRLANIGDSDSIYNLYSGRKEESFFLARRPHSSVEQTRKFLENWSTSFSWDLNSRVSLVIEEQKSKIPFGLVTLFSHKSELEFHFGLSNDFSSKGYATEVVKGLINIAQSNNRFRTLISYCDIEHKASQKVIEKSGLKPISIVKAKYVNPNQNEKPIDCINYSLTLQRSGT